MDDLEFCRYWDKHFAGRLPDLMIPGSPNRTSTRFAWQDVSGRKFVTGGFPPEMREHRLELAALLELLAANRLPVTPCLRTVDGNFGVEAENLFWQVRPWINGVQPDRLNIGNSREFGNMCAEFLIQLQNVARSAVLPSLPKPRRFIHFAAGLRKLAQDNAPEFVGNIDGITRDIDEFLHMELFLPQQLAHGDFHPANMLLQNNQLISVIDWEFAGVKTAGYDCALLVGCLGIENPDNLTGNAVAGLLQSLRDAGYFSRISQQYFGNLVTAIRLGWLGEWIETGDFEMARREVEYIAFLRRNTFF